MNDKTREEDTGIEGAGKERAQENHGVSLDGGAGIRVGGGQWKYVRGKRQKPPGGAQALWGTPIRQEVRALRGGGPREEVAEVSRAKAVGASRRWRSNDQASHGLSSGGR